MDKLCSSFILRLILCVSLLFQPLFWISGQIQAQDYVPICIDQVFDLSTGEFGPVDPSLCGKGKRMGEGMEGDDGSGAGYRADIKFDKNFKFEGESNSEHKTTDNVDNNTWSVGPSSPMDTPLGKWSDDLTQKAQNFADEMRATALINKKINDDYFFNKVLPTIFSDVGEELFNHLEEEFFSQNVLNEVVLENIKEYMKSKNIFVQVQQQVDKHFGNRVSPNIKNVYSRVTAYTIGIVLAKQVNHFALEQLTKKKMRELGQIFINELENNDWMQRVSQIIANVETELNSPLYEKQPIGKFKDYYGVENGIQKASQQIEDMLYNTAHRLVQKHIFKPSEKVLNTNSATLTQAVADSVKLTKYTHFPAILSASTPEALYEREVSNVVNRHIQSRYERKDLEILKDKGLSQPKENLYEFKSPEGEFLQKNQELYEKLKEANPFHEQGIKAREIGLVAVEVADEEYANGHKKRAQLAHSIGEGMADITLGVLPYLGVAKDVYEAITGRHLLTGRALTGLERSFSVLGIAFSTLSWGVFSSGSMRLALSKTDNVLGKINNKLLDKYLKGLSDSEITRLFREYPRSLFKAIEALGFKTTKGVKSVLYFVKRAWTKSFVRIEEVTNTLKFVDRAGIEDYTQALGDLKKADMVLPQMGEEFLAKQLRFQREILGMGQKPKKEDLVRMGRVYSAYYKSMDQVLPSSFKGKVWRGVKKSGQDPRGVVYSNSPEGVFDLPSGTRYMSRRYSIPEEEAIYTSLSKRTAIIELAEGYDLTPQEVRSLFHIGSKDIKIDQVLDLTNPGTLKQLSKNPDYLSVKNDITKLIDKHPEAYQLPQIIGHIAKRKGFKAIKAPSAPDTLGSNVVIFERLR